MRSKKPGKTHARLSSEESERVGQFNDYAFDNPNLTFEQVAENNLGPHPFPNTPSGKKVRVECKAVFDLERRS
jgi:hypothetical protein